MVRMVLDHHLGCVPLFLLEEQVAPAQRAQARVAGLARVEFPVQQPAVRAGVLHDPLGNMVPKDLRVGAGPSGNGRRSFLQQRCHSCSAVAALADSSWPASCLEKNFTGDSEAKFPMDCVWRGGCWPGDDYIRAPALERHMLFLYS